jgi:hypothetical protein
MNYINYIELCWFHYLCFIHVFDLTCIALSYHILTKNAMNQMASDL